MEKMNPVLFWSQTFTRLGRNYFLLFLYVSFSIYFFTFLIRHFVKTPYPKAPKDTIFKVSMTEKNGRLCHIYRLSEQYNH